jgi:hypothetical protein
MSNRFDPNALPLADRHYSRQKPGTLQFVRSGRCLVLLSIDKTALWVSTFQTFVKHGFVGVWECAMFRNEGPSLSSDLIREAMAATRWKWGEPPARGFLTSVDAGKVRRKRDPGRCFIRAGFERAGESKSGKLWFLCPPERIPPAEVPVNGHIALLVEHPHYDQSASIRPAPILRSEERKP